MNTILAFWPVLVFVGLELLIMLCAIFLAYKKGWEDRGKAGRGSTTLTPRLKTQPVLR